MKKHLLLCALIAMLSPLAFGQSSLSESSLPEIEDSLKVLWKQISNSPSGDEKLELNGKVIPVLVQGLRKENSFAYNFKGIQENVSILYPPDSTFRIITWLIKTGEQDKITGDNVPSEKITSKSHYLYNGAIQVNNPDKLELYPLRDSTNLITFPEDKVLTNENWYGSVYYGITEKEHRGKKFYTLFGWKNSTPISTKKVMDILHFENGVPTFGAPIIDVVRPEDDTRGIKNRFILEYSNKGAVSLNYHDDKDMIIYDHVAPAQPEGKGMYHAYLPDGTYEGFEFSGGMWNYVEKVYTVQNSDIVENPTKPGGERKSKRKKKKKKKKKRK